MGGPSALCSGRDRAHDGLVQRSDTEPDSEAIAAPDAAARPRRHHWIRTALLALLGAVAIFVVVSIVLTIEGRARPVSVDQAVSQFHGDPSADPGVHPAPGVYDYRGSGTDRLSLPPLKQAEGPTLPGTVEVSANGCWSFRIDYSTNHWQSWNYCDRPAGLAETGGLVWQRWMIGPIAETNLSTLQCPVALLSIPATPSTTTVWPARCTGTSTQIHGSLVSLGATRFVGQPILHVAGREIRSVHVEVQWRLSGPQVGTERDDLWYDAKSGLPLENQRTIHVRTVTPFGTSTYSENGQFVLQSLIPKT